ncbi:hypothetical protein ECAE60S_03484 [Eoetvoesiella caeni]
MGVRYGVEALIARHFGLCRQQKPEPYEDPTLSTTASPCRGRMRVDYRLHGQSAPANRSGLSEPSVFHDARREQHPRFFGSAFDHTVRRGGKVESSLVHPGYTRLDQQQLIPTGFTSRERPHLAASRHARIQPWVLRGSTVSLKPMAWITLNSVSELGARSPERLL